MSKTPTYFPTIEAVKAAARNLEGISNVTPLIENQQYSSRFDCNISFKREDLQVVRSYKIRGAYNKMSSLTSTETGNGVVCASAGNHAQGVALSCPRGVGAQCQLSLPRVHLDRRHRSSRSASRSSEWPWRRAPGQRRCLQSRSEVALT